MKQKVGSFYKKSLITRGLEKTNQVVKRQKAQAEVAKALQKQAANKTGRYFKEVSSCSFDFDSVVVIFRFPVEVEVLKKEDIFLLCILNFLSTLLSATDYLIKRV